jgi:hypothetical protein
MFVDLVHVAAELRQERRRHGVPLRRAATTNATSLTANDLDGAKELEEEEADEDQDVTNYTPPHIEVKVLKILRSDPSCVNVACVDSCVPRRTKKL